MAEASKLLKTSQSNISRAIRKKNTCGGFQWRLKSENNSTDKIPKSNIPTNRNKKVFQLNKINCEVLRSFESIADAASYLGNKNYRFNISMCISGKKKSAYRYKWKS